MATRWENRRRRNTANLHWAQHHVNQSIRANARLGFCPLLRKKRYLSCSKSQPAFQITAEFQHPKLKTRLSSKIFSFSVIFWKQPRSQASNSWSWGPCVLDVFQQGWKYWIPYSYWRVTRYKLDISSVNSRATLFPEDCFGQLSRWCRRTITVQLSKRQVASFFLSLFESSYWNRNYISCTLLAQDLDLTWMDVLNLHF